MTGQAGPLTALAWNTAGRPAAPRARFAASTSQTGCTQARFWSRGRDAVLRAAVGRPRAAGTVLASHAAMSHHLNTKTAERVAQDPPPQHGTCRIYDWVNPQPDVGTTFEELSGTR